MDEAQDTTNCDDLIREAGLSVTRQRQTIVRILIKADDHPDADHMLTSAREHDASISQATTHRTLAALSEKGLVHTHTFDSTADRFELAARLPSANPPHRPTALPSRLEFGARGQYTKGTKEGPSPCAFTRTSPTRSETRRFSS